MKIGKYTIETIEAGRFKLDGGAMFGIIPKPLWIKTNPSDELNRIQLNTRIIYITFDQKKVLVDTGMGTKWDEKSKQIYALDHTPAVTEVLTHHNINPDEITDVILTHLHFDHTGGSTIQKGNIFYPSFPNARYFVQKENFDWAMNPSDRDRGSYIKNNFVPLIENGVLGFTKPNEFFDEGFQFLIVNGHTFAQQLIKISDAGNTLLYCGDLVPFSSHVHLPYIMGYDLQPLVTLKEKTEILGKAADEEWILLFEHDPYIAGATVARTEKSFIIKEKFEKL